MQSTGRRAGSGEGFFARVWAMLAAPGSEWRRIASEPADPRGIFIRYAALLPALPALALILRYPLPVPIAIEYAVSVAALASLGYVLGRLAPAFGGAGGFAGGLKLAAYGMTALFVGLAAAYFVPAFAFLGTAGLLYSLYAVFLGFPIVTGAPAARSALFTGAFLITWLVVRQVAGNLGIALTTPLTPAAAAPAGLSPALIEELRVHREQMNSLMQNRLEIQSQIFRCTMGVGYGCGTPP